MEDHAAMLSLLTGPTSSLVLLLGMALGLWRFVTSTAVPAVRGWVDVHLGQVDELLRQHQQDREAWLDSMRECRENNERIDRKIGGLYGRHETLAAKVDALRIDNGVSP
ncbi:MAG: hypothetical protein CL625_00215 [Arenimonas sp.]|nr:hypothetical protein [Arenimonas sp.]